MRKTRDAKGRLIPASLSAANLQSSIKRGASAHPGGTDAQQGEKMKRSMVLAGTSALICTFALSGCATPAGSADVYGAAQTQREETIQMGTVENVRNVTIDANNGQPALLGALGGGLIGGVAGSAIGRGHGSLLMGVLGGVAGAVAGSEVQHKIAQQHGQEITVRLDDGTWRAITQNTADGMFRPGERVRLLSSDGLTRVTL
jgi:outer membrane lipoprotein SlyB